MGWGNSHNNLYLEGCCHFNIDYEIKAQSMNEYLMISAEKTLVLCNPPACLLSRGHEILIKTSSITEIIWENNGPNYPERNCPRLNTAFYTNEHILIVFPKKSRKVTEWHLCIVQSFITYYAFGKKATGEVAVLRSVKNWSMLV